MRTSTRLLIPLLAIGVGLGGYAAASAASGAPPATRGHTHHQTRWTCPPNADLTTLTVTRGSALNHETWTFPATDTASGAHVARLARLMCALPQFPTGWRSCPMDYAPTYTLVFTGPGGTRLVASASPSGCQSVRLGRGDAAARHERIATDRFWSVLGSTIGLSGATSSTFAGVLDPS